MLILSCFLCRRVELIDDAMLRPGRLGKLLYVPLPSPSDRVSILKALARYSYISYIYMHVCNLTCNIIQKCEPRQRGNRLRSDWQ